jgi:hypothetical protein
MHKLFGIESVLLERATPAEKRLLRRVMILFVIMILIALVAGGYFVYMINANYVVAAIGGLFIGFVLFSMLRFSSVTLTRRMREPEQKFRFFSSSFLVRLLLICILGMMVGFPFSAMVMRYGIGDKIAQKRTEIIEEYRSGKMESKQLANKRLMDREKALKAKCLEDSLVLSTLSAELKELEFGTKEFKTKRYELVVLENENERAQEKIIRLKDELHDQDSIQSVLIELDLKSFSDEIGKAELPMFQLRNVASSFMGWMFIAAVLTLFIFHFVFYIRFIFGKGHKYAHDAAVYYRDSVINDYLVMKQEVASLLEKFKYEYVHHEYFQDPPFNTIPILATDEIKLGVTLKEYLHNRKNSGEV